MPTPRGAWVMLDMSPKMDNAEFGDGDSVMITGLVPVNGYIREAWYGVGIAFPAGNLQLHKFTASNASINLLTAVNVSIGSAAISGNIATTIPNLASNLAVLRVLAGQTIRATWTFTTVGAGDGPSCQVWIEPEVW